MTTTLATTFEIKSWDEKPYRERADGTKLARAEVVLAGGEQLTEGAFEALLYYRADGTSTYVTLMSLAGTLDGRTGTVVLAGEGTFDGTTARGEFRVIDATGELSGLTGTATSSSTHGDYPWMPLTLAYDCG
ncbi:DUF3224 domain-containing protein [Actinoplanes oblitus]|uniref:DUF3224 domain-containing protein n=1 Tax=Actinoplanes oblitus TaxID=3040509 RepID=A0ABY8WQ62_9ACTN|nr:DUF3224 domain-containing protein [Actinoplanes oblitus]WIM99788.1 DUF3224 domain-containing protein [Actinoplanes oblitus]